VSQRDDDLKMLDELLGAEIWQMRDALESLTDVEVEAFASMRFDLRAYPVPRALTEKQRAWLVSVHERVTGGSYKNLASSGAIPPPKKPGEPGYVPLMVGPLPKKPPPMPKRVDEDDDE